MGAATYSVVCELGLEHFDDRRAGPAAAQAVHAALRRVARGDRRMRSTRLRRPSSGVAELGLVVEARSSWQAVELATAALDAAFAATGRAAVDWARVRPEVRAVPAPSRPLRRPRARNRLSVPAPPSFPGWAEVAAETRRLTAPRRPLPGLAALVAVPGPAAVIDLR